MEFRLYIVYGMIVGTLDFGVKKSTERSFHCNSRDKNINKRLLSLKHVHT